MRCAVLTAWLLLIVAAHAGEPDSRVDAFGDKLPSGALARLGTIRLRTGEFLSGIALAPDGKSIALSNSRGVLQILDVATGNEVKQFNVGYSGTQGLTYSPDGKYLVISDYGSLQVWNAATGQLHMRLQPQQRSSRFTTVSFSADGKLLASGPDGGIAQGQKNRAYVWEMDTKKELGFEVLQDYRVSTALAADGKTLATWGQHINRAGGNAQNFGQIIQLWDVKEGKELKQLTFENGANVMQASFAPDGKTLAAVAGLATVCIWDVDSGKEMYRLAGRRGMASVRHSPDGKLLMAGTHEGFLLLWDAKTGKRLGVCEGPARLQSLAFTADGQALACGSAGQAVQIWEVPSGRLLTPSAGHTARVLSLGFSTDGKTVISAAQDGKVLFWDRSTGKEIRDLPIKDDDAARYGRTGATYESIAVAPDGRHLVASSSNTATTRLFDLASGKAVCDFDSSGNRTPLAFSPDGRLVAIGDRMGGLRLWDVDSGQERAQLKANQARAGLNGGNVAFSSDGELVAISLNYYDNAVQNQVNDIQLLSTKTGAVVHQLAKIPGGSNQQGLAFSTDGRTVAQGWANSVSIWDVSSGLKQRELQGVPGTITALDYSPDGRLLACGVARSQQPPTFEVHVFELCSGRLRTVFGSHLGSVDRLAWSPDSQVIASGSVDTSVLLWDATGKTLLPGATKPVSPEDHEKLWNELADADAQKAFKAMMILLRNPAEALPFFKERLKAAVGKNLSEDDLAKLVRDLESERFVVRERATEQLAQAGRMARTALEDALRAQPVPTLELRRRVATLLDKLSREELSPEEIRERRGIELLERLATSEARALLHTLANGAGHAPLTHDARSAMGRLR